MAQPWFRMYRSAVHNPKVQRMGLELIGFWVNCLCLSDDEGVLPGDMDLAWQMRLSTQQVQGMMNELISNGLVTRYGNARYRLHDWEMHQKRGDYDMTNALRQKRFREKKLAEKQGNGNNPEMSNALHNGRVTPLEQRRIEQKEEKKDLTTFDPKKKRDRGSMWPDGAIVPDDWVSAGREARDRAGMPMTNLVTQAVMFSNYWSAKSGAGATKIDWRKTWINWCLNAKGGSNGTRGIGNTLREFADEIRADRDDGGRGEIVGDADGGDLG
jgi:hypothetical protein